MKNFSVRGLLGAICLFVAFAVAPGARAQSFTPNNIVVLQVGDGSAALSNAATPVILKEYASALANQTTPVSSRALPTIGSGTNRRLTLSGTGTSEGLLSRSSNGQYLLLAGYDAAVGTASVSGTSSTTTNRTVGRISADGTIDVTTGLADFSNANNPRSAISTNGTDIWVAGGAGGVRYTIPGSTTSTQLSTTLTNLRQVNIFNGQLYVSTGSGTALRIGTVGTGTPTTSGQTITNLPGIPTTGSPYAFFFADLSPSVPGVDVLYIADDGSGLIKYSLVGSSWVPNGVVGTSSDSYRGLAGAVTGTTVNLFATRKGGSGASGGGELVSLTDASGYNGAFSSTPTLLAIASPNTSFRGVAFAPVAAPQPDLTIALSGPSSATVGVPFTYSLVVSNGGAANATGVLASFTLPTGVAYTSAGVINGFTASQANGVVSFAGGSLTQNSSATLTVSVSPTAVATIVSGPASATIDPNNTIAESNELNNLSTQVVTTSVVNPTVNLSVSSNTASETNPVAITVTATSSAPVYGDQTVSLAVSGTGVDAGDYTLSNTTITIPNGQTTGSVTFTVVDDALVEGTETAVLTISNPSANIALGTPVSQSITITDNDVAPQADLVVAVSGPSSATVNVPFTYSVVISNIGTLNAANVSAGFTLPANVAFSAASAGNNNSGYFPNVSGRVVTFSDGTLAVNESVTLLIDGRPTAAGTVTSAPGSATIDPGNTIAESNEANNLSTQTVTTSVVVPTVNLSVSSAAASEASPTAITVTATSSAPVLGNQTVDVTVTGTGITAGDYTLSNTTITIPDGQTIGSVTFTAVDDAVVEGSETATLVINNPSANIALGGTTSQDIAITDNDFTPALSVNPTSLTFTTTAGTASAEQSYVVSATALTAGVTITASSGVEISLSSGSGFAGSLTLPQSTTSATIFVRLSTGAVAANPFSGSITNVSGSLTATVAISGTVNAANQPPVAPTLANQTGIVAVPFSYMVPAFTDPENQTLTYVITGVPAGLTADNTTRIISGTPTATGTSTVTVVATDPQSASTVGTFAISINANAAPVASTVANQTATIGTAFSLTVPAFTDAENQALSYAATGVPSPLTFDPATRVISGTPTTVAVSTITITATDPASNTVSTTFSLSVNAAPVLVRITEFMHTGTVRGGSAGEFVEITNVGSTSVDLAGWSFDDNSNVAGSFSIGSLGTLAPGESAIITEATAAAFRSTWYLPATVKVVGGNNQNLSATGSDAMNIYDASGTRIDQLVYNANNNANGTSAWTTRQNLGTNTIASWQLSVVGDAQNTYVSAVGNTGNPGGYYVPLNRVLVRESGGTPGTTTVAEGGATDTYTVALNSAPTADVTITSTPGSQLTLNPTTLTFTPANYSTVQTVTVTAVDDAVVNGTRSATITQSAASSDAAYNGIAVNPVSVTITDNDVAATAPPSVTVANTTTKYLNLSATPGYVSGVINDPTDPASTLGIDFTLSDTDTPVNSLTTTLSTNNSAVVPIANLVLTGTGGSRNLKITPTGVGYATITLAVTDGVTSVSYVVNYAASAASGTTASTRFHTGTSDASTAVPVDANYTLVGDDENQVLRLYNRQNSGLPVAGFDFTSSLGLTDVSGGVPREVDLEASIRQNNRIFWIGSESNKDASSRPNRDRVFATDVTGTGSAATLSYVGRYDFLREDIINWDVTNGHGKGANYYGLQTSAAADSKVPEGYNIEGAELAPDGTTAYIGFRAPQVLPANRTKALIVPVTNLTTLVSGQAQGSATFGAPIELNLGGRGIREIRKNTNNEYLIIAGPAGEATGTAPADFRLFTWTGNAADAPVERNTNLTALNANGSFESIVEMPASLSTGASVQLLVDNGDAVYYNDGIAAKDLTQNNFKKFRSEIVTLGAPLNTAPTVANAIAPQSATVNQAFSYTIPANTFADAETPGNLTLTVAGLPASLSLTGSVISGTPSTTVGSPYSVTVTATDPGSLSVSTVFSLSVAPAATPVVSVTGIVISQVYGGGGNSGATYKNDFVELFNRTNAPISINGWSVQYASAAGTSWTPTSLTGSIPAGGYYLVSEATSNSTIGSSLPASDAAGTINLSVSTGKVALVGNSTPLSGTCPTGAGIVDFVGYSTTVCYEGTGSAPAPSATMADLRKVNGCTDTNNNAADFVTGAPAPRNSASPVNVCGATPVASLVASPTALSGFATVAGTISTEQTYTLTSVSLSSAVSVSAPAGVEVSLTAGSGFGPTLSVPASTTTAVVYVRLTGATVGPVSGSITNTSGSLTATVTVSGSVTPANTAPTVANVVSPQSATVGVGYTLSLANTFTDAESPNNLTLTATSLPAGLTLTGTTVSGTPSSTVGSPVSVTLTATDPGNLTASTIFTITVSPAPVVVSSLSLVVSANPTAILTTGTTTLSATVSGGTGPYSYSFTGPGSLSQTTTSSTASVSGLSAGVQTFTVVVSDATSPSSQSISATVSVTVTAPAPVNTAPTATTNASQTATVGVAFSYTVNPFTDAETPNSLTYTASINPANNLTFDPITRVISGTPTASGVSSVTITATDSGSLTASTTFTIIVSPAPTPVGSTTGVVISQVYGGGGNSSAIYQNDFVELFNRSSSTVSINGWSVQYTSATGTGSFSANSVSLTGSLAPGQYYLVQLFSGGAVGTTLPTPDATGNINLSGSAGKVILVNSSAGVSCNGSSTPCSSSDLSRIVDLVGYGGANFFEGSGAAPALTNTTAAIRKLNGCTDTDNNAADFTAATPVARNSASPFNVCGAVVATLSANPTMLSGFNATVGAVSNTQTYTLTGSNLGTAPVSVSATANIELSTDNVQFSATLSLPTTASAISQVVYVRLTNAISTTGTFAGTISNTANGTLVASVSVSGQVNPVNAPSLSASPTALTSFTTSQGTVSAEQTYTLTAANLSSAISVSAPAGVEISLTSGSGFGTALILPASTTSAVVYVRLTGATAGPVSRTISNTSANLTANVTISGTVSSTAPFTPIATARAGIGQTFKVQGRVTVKNQLGSRQIYIQDETGGIAVYSGPSGTDLSTLVEIGDLVQTRGPVTVFNGYLELTGTNNFTVITSAGRVAPTPLAITPDQLAAHQGELVSVANSTITPAGSTFAGGSSYTITAGGQSGILYINPNSELAGAGQPTSPVSVTGISDRYVSQATTTGTNNLQLQPRIITDISGATAPTDQTCTIAGNSTLTRDQTLDIAAWNMEFFGADAGTITCPANKTLVYNDMGPTNEDLQQSNAVKVLTRLNADIISTEEVSDIDRFAAAVQALPGSYSYVCSDKFSYFFQDECDQVPSQGTVFGPTKFAQKVCVIYNTATVTPVLAETKPLLFKSSPDYTYPGAIGGNGSGSGWASGRLPFLFVANVTINGITKKMHIVAVHGKSGSAAADFNRRVSDYNDLKAELDRTYPTANIVMLGDYNDKATSSIYTGSSVSSFNSFVTDVTNYSVVTKPLEQNGCVTYNPIGGSFIDHITISNDLQPAYVPNSVYVLQPFSIPNYGNTTSDHSPLEARFDLSKLASPIVATLSGSASVCAGTPVALSVSITGGTSPYSVVYTANGTSTTVSGYSSGSPIAVSPAVSTTYALVSVTDAANASANLTGTAVVTVNPAVTAVISGNLTVCAGASTTLTASGGSSFTWSTGETTATISVSTAGPYSVTTTSSGGCVGSTSVSVTVGGGITAGITGNLTVCAGTGTLLTATGGNSFTWSTGETTASISATAGAYSVTVASGNCTASASATVTSVANPTAAISGAQTVCSGQSTILTASGGTSYVWSTGQTTASISATAGAYSVTATQAGCSASVSTTVTAVANPTATISGTLTVISGGSTILTAAGGTSFAWSTGQTTASISVTAGTYSVTVANGSGCFGTASATVTTVTPVISVTGVVISQVYGGGGNSGAPYKNDFVELFNRSNSPISINGWSVQYASATGTSWQSTTLTGSIPAGGYYLVQLASTSAVGGNLPTPDATGTINLGGAAGKVALVGNSTPLSGTCPTGAGINDFVGYGTTASCFEGSGSAPAPSNTLSILRKQNGCVDTDNNAADFVTGTPAPRNSASPVNVCGATPVASLVASPTALSGFATVAGTVSTEQTYTLTSASLSSAISVSAPAGVEVSLTAGSGFVSTLSVPASTTTAVVYVRLTGATAGPVSGSITNTSGSLTATVTVSGSVTPANTAPTVANVVSPQSATVGVGYTLSLANTFTDTESPNNLTLTASSLPAGLSLTGTTISGTPSTTVGSPYSVTLTATDPGGLFVSTVFSLSVAPAPIVNTAPTVANVVSPQSATVGVGFTLSLANTFTDTESPNNLTLTATSLPAGLSLTGTTVSGTPSSTVGSPVSVTLTATDPGNLTASTVFTITVSPAPVVVSSLSLVVSANPTAVLTTGTTTLSATVLGGTGPYSYSFSGPGSLSQTTTSNTASVSGLSAGVQTFTVVVTDATSPSSQSISATVSVTVTAPTPNNTAPTVVNTVGPQSATVGVGYTLSVANTFTDAETPANLTLTATSLPAGLSLTGTTISGTPSTTVGSPVSVTLTATDPGGLTASVVFTIMVAPASMSVTPTPTGPFAITGVTTVSCATLSAGQRSVSFTPQYAGLDGSSVSFAVVNELAATTNPGPYTLNLYTDNPVITLRAVQSGVTSSFAYNWLAACNGSTPTPGNTAPTVANAVGPQSATVGVGYTLSVANTFTDAQTPNSLVLSATGLPAGLSLTGTSISGTPSTTAGSPYSVTLTATDPGNLMASTVFTITVAPSSTSVTPTPTGTFAITGVTTVSCATLSVGQRSVSFTPQYAGLDGSTVSFAVVNELAATTNPGPYTLNLYTDNPVITLRSLQSGVTSSFAYNWLAACNGSNPTPGNTAPTVANTVSPQSATVGVGYTLSVANTFTDAQTPGNLVLSAAGLPAGLSLTGTSISGTPSTTVASPYSVTLTATDPGGLAASTVFAITIAPASMSVTPTPTGPFAITGVTTVSCATLSAGQRSVSFTPQYAGLDGSSVSFSVVNELATTTSPGPYTLSLYTDNPVITLRAVQSGVTSTFSYNWLAACNSGGSPTPGNTAPTVANAVSPQSATVGVGYTLSVANTFTDAQTPGSLVVSAAGLPAGLSLNGTTISGSPSSTVGSPVSVTLTATDPGGLSASTVFTITVSPAGSTQPPVSNACGSPANTIGQPLQALAPTYDCATGAIKFNTTGGDGSPVSFSAIGITGPTTNCNQFVDRETRTMADAPPIQIMATQNGVTVIYTFNIRAQCPAGSRQAALEPMPELSVRVLGNPTPTEAVGIEIRGGEGQRLLLRTIDGRGRVVSEQSVPDAKAVEQQTVQVGPTAGVYILQVSTPTQSVTTKILKR